MVTEVKIGGQERTAIVFECFNQADMPDFGKAMLEMLRVSFSNNDIMETLDSATLYLVLELYKAITEKGGES